MKIFDRWQCNRKIFYSNFPNNNKKNTHRNTVNVSYILPIGNRSYIQTKKIYLPSLDEPTFHPLSYPHTKHNANTSSVRVWLKRWPEYVHIIMCVATVTRGLACYSSMQSHNDSIHAPLDCSMTMMVMMLMMPLHSGIEMICTWYIVSSHHHTTIRVLSIFNGQQLACMYIHSYIHTKSVDICVLCIYALL